MAGSAAWVTVAIVVIAVGSAAWVVAWRLLARRYRALVETVVQGQRQLAEVADDLRRRLDALHRVVEAFGADLGAQRATGDRLQRQVTRLELAAQVAVAEVAGGLTPAVAERLREHLRIAAADERADEPPSEATPRSSEP